MYGVKPLYCYFLPQTAFTKAWRVLSSSKETLHRVLTFLQMLLLFTKACTTNNLIMKINGADVNFSFTFLSGKFFLHIPVRKKQNCQHNLGRTYSIYFSRERHHYSAPAQRNAIKKKSPPSPPPILNFFFTEMSILGKGSSCVMLSVLCSFCSS